MPDFYTEPSPSTTFRGPITAVQDGRTSVAGIIKGDIFQQNQAAGIVQTLANGNTIAVAANQSSVRVTAAGAVNGIILPAGSLGGQMLSIIHEGAAANTITFAVAANSNVAGGAAVSLAGLAAHLFIWNAVTSLWYQVGPLAN